MKTTIRKSITIILTILLITLVIVFAASCDKTEEVTEEKRWLSVSEQLEMSRMSNEEVSYEDEVASDFAETVIVAKDTILNFESDTVTQAKEQQNEITYVLNTNSKKFHEPDCSGLPTKNRRDFYGTRDEAIGEGYEPCGRCKP